MSAQPLLYRTLRDKALAYLARREHSVFELERKLSAGGEADAACMQTLLQELAAQGTQSDRRFAEQLCRVRVGSGKGPVQVNHELEQHRIEPGIIQAVLSGYAHQWQQLADTARLKKFGDAPPADYKQWARQARFLRQRGFMNDQIRPFDGA